MEHPFAHRPIAKAKPETLGADGGSRMGGAKRRPPRSEAERRRRRPGRAGAPSDDENPERATNSSFRRSGAESEAEAGAGAGAEAGAETEAETESGSGSGQRPSSRRTKVSWPSGAIGSSTAPRRSVAPCRMRPSEVT